MGGLGAIDANVSHSPVDNSSLARAQRAHARAQHAHAHGPAHASVPIESSDDEAELPTRHAVEWAVEQLPDTADHVSDVRAALANAPWLGKPWRVRWKGSPHQGTSEVPRCGESCGKLDALSFFGGPPEKQV